MAQCAEAGPTQTAVTRTRRAVLQLLQGGLCGLAMCTAGRAMADPASSDGAAARTYVDSRAGHAGGRDQEQHVRSRGCQIGVGGHGDGQAGARDDEGQDHLHSNGGGQTACSAHKGDSQACRARLASEGATDGSAVVQAKASCKLAPSMQHLRPRPLLANVQLAFTVVPSMSWGCSFSHGLA